MIRYKKEYVDKCKKIYPNDIKLHKALDENSITAGHYLSGGNRIISVEEILEANTLEELQDVARDIQTKAKLYEEWATMYFYPR